jgi:multicomponent K+:H+ antiporter subunit D
VLRIGSLLAASGAPAPFAGQWLSWIGLATIVFGIVGMLGSQQLGRIIGFAVILSSGTVLAAVGLDAENLTAPALFYLLTSALTTAAFFLLTGMTERTRTQVPVLADAAPLPPATYEGFGVEEPPQHALDEEVGIAIPAAMAFLGLAFIFCVVLVTGLPPLSGFLAKFALLSAALAVTPDVSSGTWMLVVALLAAGLAGVIALTRIGMRLFWSVAQRTTPRLRVIEAGPVAFLILLCVAVTVGASPLMTYLDAAAQMLHAPQTYIDAVLSPPPGDVR